MTLRRALGMIFLLAVTAFLLITCWHRYIVWGLWHDLGVWTGSSNVSGPEYGFFSGFGSDITEATIFTGLVVFYRHHSCNAERCFRLGHNLPGTPYRVCHRHHPDHGKRRRSVPLHLIHRAHAEARDRAA